MSDQNRNKIPLLFLFRLHWTGIFWALAIPPIIWGRGGDNSGTIKLTSLVNSTLFQKLLLIVFVFSNKSTIINAALFNNKSIQKHFGVKQQNNYNAVFV